MLTIAQLIDRDLKWVQPHPFKQEYELQADGEPAATLRWKSAFGSLATAESADGCWTFKRVGFWQTRATVRACGSDTDIATFKNNTWKGGGTLTLADGRTYLASTNFWQTQFEFKTETGERLFGYTNIGGVMRLSARVQIEPPAVTLRELPWMVMLGWYLALMLHRDSAAATAAVAATA
mgnify:CR=1 FL=1